MSENFLALARRGNNQWWRYLLGILFILLLWQGIGSIPYILLLVYLQRDGSPATQFNLQTQKFEGVPPLIPYIAINLMFVCFLIGLYITIRFLHQRQFITLITPRNQVSWKRILQGFGVTVILLALASVIESVITPGNYRFTFNLRQFLIFLPVALVLTPLQTSVEEFFFRGYLMQGIALKTRNAIIPIVLSSFLFMLPHLLNPEVKSGFFLSAAYYLVFGLFMALITIKDNCLELALGIHAGNNLYNALFASYADGAIPAPSIFTIQELNPQYNLLSTLIIFTLFYLFFFRRRKQETQRLGED